MCTCYCVYLSPTEKKKGGVFFFIKKKIFSWKITPDSIMTGPLRGDPTVSNERKSYIMSMRPDGSDKEVIMKFITKSPSFLIVGNLNILYESKQLILLTYSDAGQVWSVYRVNIDGSNLVKLLDIGRVNQFPELFISPDETRLAYTGKRDGAEDWPSSWLINLDGQGNHMICGEESNVIGWTKDGKLVIGALADAEGNVKPKYKNGKGILYGDNIRRRILIYDFLSKKFDVKNPSSFVESHEILKSLGVQERNTGISPDGKKKLFSQDGVSIGIRDIDGKNERILLKGKIN